MLHAELTKLRRSSTWVIAIVLPVLAVVTGTLNAIRNEDALGSGWGPLTSQVVLFYGFLFYSLGISLLTATVWRTEHQGTNWNLLLTTTAAPLRLVAAKAASVLLLVAVMQAVLVGGTAAAGLLVLHLEEPFPWQFALTGLIALVAALPLVGVQSLLSMLLRSFAAPVALCLLGCVVGIASVTSTALRPLSYVLPQAIATRALNLGSFAALADSGGVVVPDVAPLLASSLVLAALLAWLAAVLIRTVRLR
ncbi:lantibiotic ABC transporter permease [Actinomyces sp. 2119]|uniref:Lantibiotic ABC transporter permease n=1 Tax=Actinomyces lilanjuaniae TaxID=2321394 RepID=A0ABM6Z6Q0_9ACTO|nr:MULTISPECIES: ABC transporter permease [Actinomyces]AYD90942.1 lantibiotic ABC transporter permease [Actinomyces lilanjuaniae]RJF41594.1 lantibiotic ABC transporter permease [Actinomyces sp. 2119]